MKNIMAIVAAALACGVECLGAQDIDAASPESQGVSSKAILRWIEACENNSVTNRLRGHMHGFVILRHGRFAVSAK